MIDYDEGVTRFNFNAKIINGSSWICMIAFSKKASVCTEEIITEIDTDLCPDWGSEDFWLSLRMA